MTRRAFVAAALITVAAALPVRADYTSIQANLIDLVPAPMYYAGGVL